MAINGFDKELETLDCGTESDIGEGRNSNPGAVIVREKRLYYTLEENPPWYLTIFLGLQHYVTMASSTVSGPIILSSAMCMADGDVNVAHLCSTIMFVSGLITLLQTTFGTRLPIIQGGSFAFLVPTLAILSTKFECPQTLDGLSEAQMTEIWQVRMREIQGAIIVSSFFEIFLGLFGIVGMILKYISPLTVASAITMIGLSLFKTSAEHAASHWGISCLTIVLIILFSQYCAAVKVPIPFSRTAKRNGLARFPIFQVFPVLLAITIVWILCLILTLTNVFPIGSRARTDFKTEIIGKSDWFVVPYPFQWGMPTVTLGSVLGMLCAVLTGTVESIGDYYACAEIVEASIPPTHAMNRGIFMEGFGCLLAGIWGTGTGTTSYSGSIGALALTKVGSRSVIQTAGLFMVAFGLIGKFGAFFVCIPEPVIGGVFCVLFATIAAVGLSNLDAVDLKSARNLFVIGFSILFSLTVSEWVGSNPGAIRSGSDQVDQVLTILLKTGMFVSGVIGFVLDNTIPGTREERGLNAWVAPQCNLAGPGRRTRRDPSYDLPLITSFVERFKLFRRVPISPTYNK